MTGVDIMIFLNLIIGAITAIASFMYFAKVRDQYRWIKLFWGLEMTTFTILLIWALLGGDPSGMIQLSILLLPTTCLLWGIISAFSRLKEMNATVKILESKLEQTNNQLTNLPTKDK